MQAGSVLLIAQCWSVAFHAAHRRPPIIFQHLLLGMNAHINLDLGIACAEVAPGPAIDDLELWDRVAAYEEDLRALVGAIRAIGAEPYLAGNLGSGTPDELRDWMEYCNYPAGSSLSAIFLTTAARQASRTAT